MSRRTNLLLKSHLQKFIFEPFWCDSSAEKGILTPLLPASNKIYVLIKDTQDDCLTAPYFVSHRSHWTLLMGQFTAPDENVSLAGIKWVLL